MRGVRLVVAALTVLAVSGCSGSSAGSSSSSQASPSSGTASSPTPASSTSPSAAPTVPAAPPRAACYLLTTAQLTAPTNDSTPVPCSARHTARTIFVGRLRPAADGQPRAVDSPAVQQQLATTCPRKLAAWVGGSPGTRDLSRFNVVWYSPTLEQADQGAAWFRCDLIAFADQEQLFPLPRHGGVKGALDRSGALDTYGLCGNAAPGTPGFARLICARHHTWRAIDAIHLAGGRSYPGITAVRTKGDATCKAVAQARSGDPLKFKYGWEWPTRAQWIRGQHFGYCWMPA